MNWYEITPRDAVDIALPREGIEGPVNEMGEPCPWPWEPQQLVGVPLGQYHCKYCGAMCVAGVPHPDYRDDDPPGVQGPNVDHAWIDEADLFGAVWANEDVPCDFFCNWEVEATPDPECLVHWADDAQREAFIQLRPDRRSRSTSG